MSVKAIESILERPIITEKTTNQNDMSNQVVFKVRRDANKIEIRKAVETLLNVEVTSVNTAIVRGKTRRVGRITGRRPNWKRAVVTLSPGQEIEFFKSLDGFEDDEDFIAEDGE